MKTTRLTVAQAVVKWMIAQSTILPDGTQAPMFPGIYGIFGHGNVTSLGHALEEVKEEFPTWRGQNEQGMALAGVAYAKAVKARQIMAVTSSVGPGATNMVTAAGVAMADRLPLLIISGDGFNSRIPGPVLQQVEHFHDPSMTVNDAFRSVTTYWDRIVHPAQIVQSLPAALQRMWDPASRGPAFLGLPQDVQAMAFDYADRFFEPTLHKPIRARADSDEMHAATAALTSATKPVIISGGGVHYSNAEATMSAFAAQHNIPVVETVAGKSSLLGDDPYYAGTLGVTGSDAANNLIAEADVVLSVGCRLQDFATGSWTVFKNPDMKLIGLNTTRHDAGKHKSMPLVGDAAVTLEDLSSELDGWKGPQSWVDRAQAEKQGFRNYLDSIGLVTPGDTSVASYAQVVRTVNDIAKPTDICLAAAGGFPGEVNNGWWSKGVSTFDCEYGFSCMGYEIGGGWGAAMAYGPGGGAENDGDVFVFVGDGSYLMANSELYSSVLSGHKMIVIVCDNAGFAVINRLQVGQGGRPFNNLLADCKVDGELAQVDFAAHARSMGCEAETIDGVDELAAAVERARQNTKTSIISMKVDAYTWTEGGSFWEVGVPEVSNLESVNEARALMDQHKADQRVGW